MAYFAQFALDVPARRDGHRLAQRQWLDRREDGRNAAGDLRAGGDGPPASEIVLGGNFRYRGRRRLSRSSTNFPARYIADLDEAGRSCTRKLKVVAACGNGTAGAFAPQLLARSAARSCRSIASSISPFPRYNPNPEDLHMLHAMARRRCCETAPMSGSASTATATAAASSTTRARRSSPTRSA